MGTDKRLQVMTDLVRKRMESMTPQEHRIAVLRRQTPEQWALANLHALELDVALAGTARKRGKKYGSEQPNSKARRARVAYLKLHLIPKLGTTPPDSPDALATARSLLAKVDMKQNRDARLRQEIADALK